MWTFLAIFLALIPPSFAAAGTDVSLPAVHSVSGLTSGDVLNVRSGPSTRDPVIGRLPEGREVEVTARSGGWGRIILGEGDGWVAMRYLKAQPMPELPEALYCGGTEPFWSLAFEVRGGLTFTEMGQEPVTVAADWRHGVSGRLAGSFATGSDGYTAVFHRRECSDGMSDRTYGWAIDFLRTGVGGAYFQGCCRMLR